MSARLDRPLNQSEADDRQLAGSTGNNNIKLGQTLADIFQANRRCAKTLGKRATTIDGELWASSPWLCLREEGAVACRAEAQTRFYSLRDPVVSGIIHALCELCD